MTLDSRLSWNPHIESIIKKGNQQLFFLKRNINSCPRHVKEICYFTYVRPKVEYASSVWDPHLIRNINNIEKIQRRAARFVTNSYNYQTTDCDTLLKTLQWTPLIERRQQFKVNNLYKARNNLLHIPLNHINRNNTRAGLRGDYVIQRGSGEQYHSFSLTSVQLWNAIPSSTRDASSIEVFKKGISKLTFKSKY